MERFHSGAIQDHCRPGYWWSLGDIEGMIGLGIAAAIFEIRP